MPEPLTFHDLKAAPEGAQVTTGDGYVYTRVGSHWSAPQARKIPPAWLLDPEHSRQPILPVEGTWNA